jgi:hypothetical protein
MVERFGHEDEKHSRKNDLATRLSRHPHLGARIESLLDIIDNAGDDIEKASAAEQRVMEELRKMGNEALHSWAENQERKKTEQLEQSDSKVNKKEKKALLVHVLRNNRASRAGLYLEGRFRDSSTVFSFSRDIMSRIFFITAACYYRFWSRGSIS